MNFSKINLIAYKTLCIAGAGGLFIIGFKIVFDDLFFRGLLCLVCSVLLILLLLSKPKLIAWLQLIFVIAVAINTISGLARI